MLSGQLPLCRRESQLLVDKLIIKTDTGRIGLAVEIEQFVGASPVDGTQTHGARLATTVDHTAMQLMATQLVAGGADGFHFCVGGGVMLAGNPVAALANDDSILYHQCRKGAAQALANIIFSECEDRLDQVLVIMERFHGSELWGNGMARQYLPACPLAPGDLADHGVIQIVRPGLQHFPAFFLIELTVALFVAGLVEQL